MTTEIKIFVQLPTTLDAPQEDWTWIECLSLSPDFLRKLHLSHRPFKWLRFAIAVVVGMEGDLSISSTPHPADLVDYNADEVPDDLRDLYYHCDAAEKAKSSPIDPDIIHTKITSAKSVQRDRQFRRTVSKRDNEQCVLSGVPAKFCHAAHLLAHSKGPEYIEQFTSMRSRDPNHRDIVDDIDSPRNGILLNPIAHAQLGLNLVFLPIPNFAMGIQDVNPSLVQASGGTMYIAQLLSLDPKLLLGAPTGGAIQIADSSDAPPQILFEAVYAGALVKQFGTEGYKAAFSECFSHRMYSNPVRTRLQVEQKAIEEQREADKKECIQQATEREERWKNKQG